MWHTCCPRSSHMAFHLQNSRAIFKIYLPFEQNLECCFLQTVVNHYYFIKNTSKRAYTTGGDYWIGYKGHLKKKNKTSCNQCQVFQETSELALFHGFFWKQVIQGGKEGMYCILLSGWHSQVGQWVMCWWASRGHTLKRLLECSGTCKHQGQCPWSSG